MFIMMDFKTGEFIDIYPDRRKNYLTSKFSAIKNRTYNDKTHKFDNLNQVLFDKKFKFFNILI